MVKITTIWSLKYYKSNYYNLYLRIKVILSENLLFNYLTLLFIKVMNMLVLTQLAVLQITVLLLAAFVLNMTKDKTIWLYVVFIPDRLHLFASKSVFI